MANTFHVAMLPCYRDFSLSGQELWYLELPGLLGVPPPPPFFSFPLPPYGLGKAENFIQQVVCLPRLCNEIGQFSLCWDAGLNLCIFHKLCIDSSSLKLFDQNWQGHLIDSDGKSHSVHSTYICILMAPLVSASVDLRLAPQK